MQWFHASKLPLNLMKAQYMKFNLKETALPKNSKTIVQNIEIGMANSFMC